jgi:hypothetical protein
MSGTAERYPAGVPSDGAGGEGAVGRARRFTATVRVDGQGRTHVPVPFDPDEAWGPKPRHHVTGTVGACRLRGVVEGGPGGHAVVLGPAWRSATSPASGDRVEVVLDAEGPQRADLAPDVAAALDAAPDAAAFFDSLAQFYRKAYLSWIDATKRQPQLRPVRIAEMVRLLQEGKKQRPRT